MFCLAPSAMEEGAEGPLNGLKDPQPSIGSRRGVDYLKLLVKLKFDSSLAVIFLKLVYLVYQLSEAKK